MEFSSFTVHNQRVSETSAASSNQLGIPPILANPWSQNYDTNPVKKKKEKKKKPT